jgi:hypothetical protein
MRIVIDFEIKDRPRTELQVSTLLDQLAAHIRHTVDSIHVGDLLSCKVTAEGEMS